MTFSEQIIKEIMKTSIILINFRPQFDSNNYKKPDPFYGFVHDQYIVSSDHTAGKKDNKRVNSNPTTTNANVSNNKNSSEKR